jgi:hypothetical protein
MLIDRNRADLRVYIESTRSLDGLDGETLELAYKRSERAREAFEKSRVELLKHYSEHGC